MVSVIIRLLLSLFLMGNTVLMSQDYYFQSRDASGFDTAPYQVELDSAAARLGRAFPLEFQHQFKVYSFGFYSLEGDMSGGLNQRWIEFLDDIRLENPYYLVFGRQSDSDGIYTKFWFDLKLPEVGDFSCAEENNNDLVLLKVRQATNNLYRSYDNSPYFYSMAEAVGMEELQSWVTDIVGCCTGGANKSNECNALEGLDDNPYIEFNGGKYFDGDELTVCGYSGELAMELRAFSSEGVPCDNPEWERVIPVEGNIGKLSGHSTFTSIDVGMDCSGDNVSVTIILDTVEFVSSEDGEYAFDDNNIEAFHRIKAPYGWRKDDTYNYIDNPSYATPVFRNFPWKLNIKNEPDKVGVLLLSGIELIASSNNVEITLPESLSMSSTDDVEITVREGVQKKSALEPEFGNDLSCNLSNLNLFSSKHVIKDVAIIFVRNDESHELSYSVDEEEFRSELRSIYRPIGVQFDKIDFYNEIYEYDLNKDNLVEVLPVVGVPFGPEVNPVVDNFREDPRFNIYHGVLVIFDKVKKNYTAAELGEPFPKATDPKGRMPFNQRFGAIYFGREWDSPVDRIKTIAHELGHGIFTLRHPYDEFDVVFPFYYDGKFQHVPDYGPDPLNLMNINPLGIELHRYYQFDKIHENE